MYGLEGGGGAALCGSVGGLVDFIRGQVHLAHVLEEAFHDGVDAPLGCQILFGLEGVAEDVLGGTGEFADDL